LKRTLFLALIGVFLCIGNANALLIDSGWFKTDTNSGLDWLDINLTAGISMDDILSNASNTYHINNNNIGWIADGWRYTTELEIYGLYSNFSPATYNSYSPNNLTPANNFINFFGATNTANTFGWYPRGTLANWAFVRTAYGNSEGVFYTWSGPRSSSEANNAVGSWLVKETSAPVPEPATMLLFVIGLLGLTGASRKKQ
jgi:hypothetical protein